MHKRHFHFLFIVLCRLQHKHLTYFAGDCHYQNPGIPFLGSMLPQYMALSLSKLVLFCLFVKKKFECPFVGLHCGCAPPPSVNICVSVRCVSVQLVTLWVRPYIGRQSSLDYCILPTPLCGIFTMKERCYRFET